MSIINVVLADDHPLILDALENVFRLTEDIVVRARCRDGAEALQAVRDQRPDVLVLDIRMPGMNGLALVRALKQEKLPTRVVVLTAALDENEVLEAIRLGVKGVVLKEMAPRLLVQCLRTVHAGGEWLEKHSVRLALDKLLRREAGTHEVDRLLTPREIEIVRMVAGGHRNKAIAERLRVTEGTVKLHLHNVYEKLHVEGRVALTLYAQDRGLV
jgi:DNA-binding NarL/FixJ family response regulator